MHLACKFVINWIQYHLNFDENIKAALGYAQSSTLKNLTNFLITFLRLQICIFKRILYFLLTYQHIELAFL